MINSRAKIGFAIAITLAGCGGPPKPVVPSNTAEVVKNLLDTTNPHEIRITRGDPKQCDYAIIFVKDREIWIGDYGAQVRKKDGELLSDTDDDIRSSLSLPMQAYINASITPLLHSKNCATPKYKSKVSGSWINGQRAQYALRDTDQIPMEALNLLRP